MAMKKPHRPAGAHAPDRAKNFTGTWKKLLGFCRKYWPAMIAAVIFAMTGTVLTLMGPDKVSELTKKITEGMFTSIDMPGNCLKT